MALTDQTNRKEYTASGTASEEFAFPFPYFAESDLVVTKQSSGVLTTLTINVDYTQVATNGDTLQGGKVVAINPFTAGDIIVVARIVNFTQEYDLQEGADIDPTGLNTALDRVVAQNQQQENDISRMIVHPITDPSSTTYTVSTTTDRANKALGYDASGNITELSLLTTGTVTVNTQSGLDQAGNIISAKVDSTTTDFNSSGQIEVKTISNTQMGTNAVKTTNIEDAAVTFAKLTDVSTDLSTDSSATKIATANAVKVYADGLDEEYVTATGGTTDLVKTTSGNSAETTYTYNIADFTGVMADGSSITTANIRQVIIENKTVSSDTTEITLSGDAPTGSRLVALTTASAGTHVNTFYYPINASQGALNLYHIFDASSGTSTTTIKGFIIKN